MYPYLRLLKVILRAKSGKKISIEGVSVIKMRVWPNDIDIYAEMNNGKYLTILDLGRIDLAVRTGIWIAAKKNRWALVAGGANVRFRRKLVPWQRFKIKTALISRDEKWFYFHQQVFKEDQVCLTALIRAGLMNKDGLIPTFDVLKAIGSESWAPDLPVWVLEWIKADKLLNSA